MYLIHDYKIRDTNEFMRYVKTHDSERCLKIIKNRSKGTQTDYRDSETQTIPWEPPYKLSPNDIKPEVLNLTSLRWNGGLPAGMKEINIINRMRMKKAWESILPPLDCKANIQTHDSILTMIDRDEWATRDKELQSEMDSRLTLMNEIIKNYNIEQKKRVVERLEKMGKHLNQIRAREISQIKHELNRELRKLNCKYHGKNSKSTLNSIYNKQSIKTNKDYYIFKPELSDESFNSFKEFYDTILRKKIIKDYKPMDVTDVRIPKISHARTMKRDNKQLKDLCIRQTKWSDNELQILHEDLKNMRLNNVTREKKKILSQRSHRESLHFSSFLKFPFNVQH